MAPSHATTLHARLTWTSRRDTILSMLLIPASATDSAGFERIRTSPFAWILAGVLLLAAAYFVIRLLELDLVNEETPNQDDPLPR